MGQEILVIGPSGTGKSTSLETLNPKETAIVNPTGKALPFKGYKNNYIEFTKENQTGNLFNIDTSTGAEQALTFINDKMPHIKTAVVDDGNYLMAFEFIKRAKETGYAKFTEIGAGYSSVIMKGKKLRPDLNFILMMHPEVDIDAQGNKVTKAKTVGKLIDQYLNIEGMFSIVLYSKVKATDKGMQYVFMTQNDGSNTGKSPKGMFSTLEIPNDMTYVLQKINEYNN